MPQSHQPDQPFVLVRILANGERQELQPRYAEQQEALAHWRVVVQALRAEQAAGRPNPGGTVQVIDTRTGEVLRDDTI